MAILQDLPFSLSQPGPLTASGVGNFYLQTLPEQSETPSATLFFLDSHAGIENPIHDPDYQPIQPSQIDWFTQTSQTLRRDREEDRNATPPHLSLAFFHIPLPEFADPRLRLKSGHRREPTEGPSVNTHFYDALVAEGVAAVGCGHDHVNDFCGFLSTGDGDDVDYTPTRSPWLCHAGGAGFGGYGSYGGTYYHRRVRVWEIDTATASLKTWKRVEYAGERVDETPLVAAVGRQRTESGAVSAPDSVGRTVEQVRLVDDFTLSPS